jgi:N-acyl-D-aspartate/D-glutamate deacylase
MVGLLRDALAAGAFGLSGGLVYTPGSYGSFEELVALNRVVAEANKIWVVHIRYEGDRIAEGLEEMFRLVEETGVALHVSHFKALGRRNWGRGPEIVARIEERRGQGMDISVDQYPYDAGSTMLAALLPPWAHARGPQGVLDYLADPSTAARIEREVDSGLPDWEGFVAGTGWENIRISGIGNGSYPDLIGKSLAEIAETWHCTPFEAMTRLLTEAELAVSMIVHAMHEDDVAAIMQAPWRTGGTDALLGGTPHPRTYGSYPRVLSHFVRDRGILSLAQAIHQMTGAAARRLGLSDRGTIAIGNWADLVVFDPETVRDTATYAQPEQHPIGIAAILVNGAQVARQGTSTGALPGHLLRQR